MNINGLYEFLSALTKYRAFFGVAALLLFFIIVLSLLMNALRHLSETRAAMLEMEKEENLRNIDYETLDKKRKAAMLRKITAPDGLDPGPNSYLVINDGGKDLYVRSLTIVAMPKRDRFANTFSELFDFPMCTSSVFIEPLSEATMISKMDRHITILSSEYGAAAGDPNRQRKLNAQFQDASDFAEQIESGENRFFSVGFVFSLYAESLKELNKSTDRFRAKALAKNISVTNCFAVQAEAYLANAPMNRRQAESSALIKSDAIKFFQMDKYSVSAIYNYTQGSYSHKNGIALGRDLQTASPIIFDIYDQSHDGYTVVIAGKTGCGKSATIKMMCCRQLIQGYHFAVIDSQTRKGMSEGEYAGIAQMCNGVNFQISNSSQDIMNIFEVSETTKTIKDDQNMIHEVRTLDLSDKITMIANVIEMMVQGDSDPFSPEMQTYISAVITDNIARLYKSFGIYNGDPDSLYSQGIVEDGFGGVSAGKSLKKLPTMTDFYKQILLSHRDNADPTLNEAYSLVTKRLKNYVKELYYSEKTCKFFTKKQYQNLPIVEGSKGREYINDEHIREAVIEVHGIRAYYDGQSSVHVNKDCPFTNIDISQLPDSEKVLARQVAMAFMNENFIKKNSENINGADKLVCIFDECHENFKNDFARTTLDDVVRTARKRNVAIILCSQTVHEYENYKETKDMIEQAAVKLIFKQDYQEKDLLVKNLGLTEAQASYIVNTLGGNPDDESSANAHRGEMCIIDNKQVAFCKVDYLKNTEALPVETDARSIEALFTDRQKSA